MSALATEERVNSIVPDDNPAPEDSRFVLTLLVQGAVMLTTIRRLGNSQGILIPKPLLQQVGLVDQAELAVEGDALVLRKPKAETRAGWAEAAKRLAADGDDALVIPGFANENDAELAW